MYHSRLLWLVARCCAVLAVVLAPLASGNRVRASGAVERMVQVLVHPNVPDLLVLRFGKGSDGFLVSRDRGRTFKATCSRAIEPERTDLITWRAGDVPNGSTPLLIDAQGRLLATQIGSLWSDDGRSCVWSRVDELEGQWIYSFSFDPSDPTQLVAGVTYRTASDAGMQPARAELWRRTGETWARVGRISPDVQGQNAYAGDLIATATEGGTRLYASFSTYAASATRQDWWLARSDDGGATWSTPHPLPTEAPQSFRLLAVDPHNPDRILGVLFQDNAADHLFLSNDAGATFTRYGDNVSLTIVSGVAFDPSGRVFIGDTSEGGLGGGVWTAAQLGEPLSKIEGACAIDVDCIGYDAQAQKLQVCAGPRFGLMDPVTGAFEERVHFETVDSLVDCQDRGVDIAAVCEPQLNAGSSWCCTGHYPFTDFCGQYDVTQVSSGTSTKAVFCGLSGRQADTEAGRGPSARPKADASASNTECAVGADSGVDAGGLDAGARDGGVRDAAVRDSGTNGRRDSGSSGADSDAEHEEDEEDDEADGAPRKKDDGCALAAPGTSSESVGGTLVSLGILLAALGRSLRRRAKR